MSTLSRFAEASVVIFKNLLLRTRYMIFVSLYKGLYDGKYNSGVLMCWYNNHFQVVLISTKYFFRFSVYALLCLLARNFRLYSSSN